MREIIPIKANVKAAAKKRTAAYARVSKETERLENSLSAQTAYFEDYIKKNPALEFAGVYADRFVSGTQAEKRPEFNRLISDCEAGKIDLVLVKSVSRFARSTLDLLNAVRRLKDAGVGVYFEKENINTQSGDGEFMLTVLASFAQDEVRDLSDNVKWSFKKRFEKGIPHHRCKIFGYDTSDGGLVVNADEAETVKRIYADFLAGKSMAEITRETGGEYALSYAAVRGILLNETYTGALVMQKSYIDSPITKKHKINKGELAMYVAENDHEAIITREMFDAVSEKFMSRRRSVCRKQSV